MSQFKNKDKRNFGYGRQLNYAGLQALRASGRPSSRFEIMWRIEAAAE
jgi:hypothetical protein